MLTYDLTRGTGPLYETLYRLIRSDILAGRLSPGEKLPSKRVLADHLRISKVTVETAYAQLQAEGYIRSREKVGYFVEAVEGREPVAGIVAGAVAACAGTGVDGGFDGLQPAGDGVSVFHLGQAAAGRHAGLRAGAAGGGAQYRRAGAAAGHCGLSL